MSIPIPIILALLAQKNTNKPTQNMNNNHNNLLAPIKGSMQQVNSAQQNRNMITKLNGVAQLIGGSRGAKISSVANIMSSVNSINSPINALSLIAKTRMKSPITGLLSGQSTQNINGTSNIYNSINNMLNNMDKDKKEELMSMAQSIMNSSK